jgi:hypothetical protein
MPPQPSKLSVLACAALAAGALAACGGGDDNKQQFGATVGSGPSTLTKDQFVQQANQICDQGNKELDTASQALGQNPTADQISSFATDTVVPAVERQVSDIRALGAPAGDEEQVNALLDAAQADAEKVKSDPTVLANGDPFADANKLADDYGLTSCGSGGGGGGSDGSAAPTQTDTGTVGGTAPPAPGTDSDGNGIPAPSN